MQKISGNIFKLYVKAHQILTPKLIMIPGFQLLLQLLFRCILFFIPRIIVVHGSKMRTDPYEATFFIAAAFAQYEQLETQIFTQIVKKGDVVVDLGANVGYYTLLASKLVGEQGKVFAFEPNPKTYSLLVQNINLNKYCNIIPIKKAITNKLGIAQLYLSREPTVDTLYRNEGHRKAIEVETDTLDNFFQNREHDINIIKMDIEGCEMDALAGMNNLICRNNNLKIFVEFVPMSIKRANYSPTDLINKLLKNGFRIYVIDTLRKCLRYIEYSDEIIRMCEYTGGLDLLLSKQVLEIKIS